jgi:hypothetical protein
MIAIWWTGLIVTLLVFVPLAVYLLHRTWEAAHSIQVYAREALTAAAGVAGNTQHIPALDATLSTAGQMLSTAVEVDGKLKTIADVLAQRAGS